MLTNKERERYDRQILISGFGEEGQKKLKRASVFIAGAGGLGSPVAIYLAAAGVGRIRICDCDQVQLSNLNRQIIHGEEDLGRAKTVSAKEKLVRLNNGLKVEAVNEIISATNVLELIDGCDVIVDAMDNLPTRHILNKAALEKNKPLFHGAVYGFEGRATTIIPGKTACLKCGYRSVYPGEKFPVIGVAPAVIGSIQATEVIKYIVGIGDLLINRLLVYNGLEAKFTEFKVKKDPDCDHCGHLIW
jgi:molybdopterin/thiamine biosynthesis adenylyltransferase